MGAYVPNLVTDERQLGPANSAWSSLENLSFILGPAIGGLLLAFGCMTLAFVLNALTFMLVAFILWGLPPSTNVAPVAGRTGRRRSRTRRDGTDERPLPNAGPPSASPSLQVAPHHQRPWRCCPWSGLGIIQALDGFFDSGLQTLTVILAINVLHAGEAANGYLNAAIGVGGLLGAIGSGVLVLRRDLRLPLLIAAVIFGVGLLFLGAIPLLVVAMVAIAVANAGAMILDVVMTTIFQRVVPDELRGRWIGLFMSVNTLVGAVGPSRCPSSSSTSARRNPRRVPGWQSSSPPSPALALIGRSATREPSPFETTLAEVAKLPLFAGVPSARLEAALARVREAPVTAGQVVVRQGDPADRFFMIESGLRRHPGAAPGAPSRSFAVSAPTRCSASSDSSGVASHGDGDGRDGRSPPRARRPGLPRARRCRRSAAKPAARPLHGLRIVGLS